MKNFVKPLINFAGTNNFYYLEVEKMYLQIKTLDQYVNTIHNLFNLSELFSHPKRKEAYYLSAIVMHDCLLRKSYNSTLN